MSSSSLPRPFRLLTPTDKLRRLLVEHPYEARAIIGLMDDIDRRKRRERIAAATKAPTRASVSSGARSRGVS